MKYTRRKHTCLFEGEFIMQYAMVYDCVQTVHRIAGCGVMPATPHRYRFIALAAVCILELGWKLNDFHTI